eukprot:s107_g24.t1
MAAKPAKGIFDRGHGRNRLFDNITETIGNTPCVKLNDRLAPKGRTIYVKLEYFNPLGSVKDRLAIGIIEQAENEGRLKPGDTLIEATSGNTGIGLAMLCAQRGYKCVLVMAESFSVERRKLMRFLGARVILTPKSGKGTGMVEKARELAEKHGWLLCHQFETPANAKIHYDTTGQEILNDFQGTRLDYFVTGYGTGGTYAGAGKALREKRPEVKLCLAEPADAPLVASGHKMERRPDGSAEGSHPAFRPHPIQGWTPDFLAKVAEDGVKELGYDEYVPIPSGGAIEMAMMLCNTQGIFTGISGGASTWAAIEIAKKAPEGSAARHTLAQLKVEGWPTLVSQGFSPTLLKDELGWKTLVSQGLSPTLLKDELGATFLLPNVAFETRLKYQVEGWKTLVPQGFSPTLLKDELGAQAPPSYCLTLPLKPA